MFAHLFVLLVCALLVCVHYIKIPLLANVCYV